MSLNLCLVSHNKMTLCQIWQSEKLVKYPHQQLRFIKAHHIEQVFEILLQFFKRNNGGILGTRTTPLGLADLSLISIWRYSKRLFEGFLFGQENISSSSSIPNIDKLTFYVHYVSISI